MLKNKEEVIKNLAEIMMDLELERNRFQTDVFLYVDDDGNGSLDTFVNVDGGSWLDDGHYTIYSDKGYTGNILDSYAVDDIASVLGISTEELKIRVAKHNGYEDVEDVDTSDIYDYVEDVEEVYEAIEKDYEEAIRDDGRYYLDMAYEAMEEYEEHLAELEEYEKHLAEFEE